MNSTTSLIFFFISLLSVWTNTAFGETSTNSRADILPAKTVFTPKVTHIGSHSINITIDIQPGYYLYRTRLLAVASANNEINIIDTALSSGKLKTDEYFGEQSVWVGGETPAELSIRYDNPNRLQTAALQLSYQGCQDGVICYPPQTVQLPIELPNIPANNLHSSGNTLLAFGQDKPQANARVSSALTSAPKPLLTTQNNSGELLSEDEAFPFTVEAQDATTLTLNWRIADGYYLYRDKLKASATDTTTPDSPSPLVDIALANGDMHHDEFFGEQAIYRGNLVAANIYLKHPVKQLTLDVQFQGCADVGVCYPVMQRTINLDNGFVSSVTHASPNTENSTSGAGVIERLSDTLRNNLWAGVGLLLLAGIALAFTPCVLPMLPILLGIITNQRQVSKTRAAVLSSAYALGVAVMMALFGLVVAKTGINIQIIFQQPLWLLSFAAIFIVMGLAMLGVFSIAMPNSVQNRVIRWQNRFQDSSPVHVFIVGALSTLVVGPCIAPPLIAILAFISTTNDSTLGAIYLFALGLGMSLPLVVFATLSATMPKTGAFSRLVTRIFAMLMFGVGLWLLARLLPGAVSLGLWGLFFIVLGTLFWRSGLIKPFAKRLSQGAATLAFALGVAWLTGAIMGNSNPLKPFTTVIKLPFTYINDSQSLTEALKQSRKPVMLDLYADWCVSCQEIEHITFANTEVIEALSDFTLLKLDITKTSDAHRELLRKLNLIGPPALLFFNGEKELKNQRQIGAIKPQALLEKLRHIKKAKK